MSRYDEINSLDGRQRVSSKKGLGKYTGHNRHLRLWDLIILESVPWVGTGSSRLQELQQQFGSVQSFSIVIAAFASAYLPSPLQSLRLASFNQLEPIIVTSMPSLESFPWIGLVDRDEFMTAVSGVASGWAAYFKGLLANLGWSLPTDFKQVLVQLRELMWISYLFWSWSSSCLSLMSKAVLRFNSLLVLLRFSALALFILVGIFT